MTKPKSPSIIKINNINRSKAKHKSNTLHSIESQPLPN